MHPNIPFPGRPGSPHGEPGHFFWGSSSSISTALMMEPRAWRPCDGCPPALRLLAEPQDRRGSRTVDHRGTRFGVGWPSEKKCFFSKINPPHSWVQRHIRVNKKYPLPREPRFVVRRIGVLSLGRFSRPPSHSRAESSTTRRSTPRRARGSVSLHRADKSEVIGGRVHFSNSGKNFLTKVRHQSRPTGT